MSFFKKSSMPQLDPETVSRILEQTFEANEMEKNTIPLEVLASYSNYRRERFSLQRMLLIVIMLLFVLLPLLFIPASFTIGEDPTAGRDYNTVYALQVDSFMLVDRVNATIDGYNIPIYEVDSHVYSIEPSRNGRMAVTVTLANRQSRTQYIDVTTVDREIPIATSCVKEDDLIYLYLSDDHSGVDFSALQAFDLNGNEIIPVSIDTASGCVTFFGVEDTLNIYVPDLAGNRLQLILSIP